MACRPLCPWLPLPANYTQYRLFLIVTPHSGSVLLIECSSIVLTESSNRYFALLCSVTDGSLLNPVIVVIAIMCCHNVFACFLILLYSILLAKSTVF